MVICWFSGAHCCQGSHLTRVSAAVSHPPLCHCPFSHPVNQPGEPMCSKLTTCRSGQVLAGSPTGARGRRRQAYQARTAALVPIGSSLFLISADKISHFSAVGCCCFAGVCKTTFRMPQNQLSWCNLAHLLHSGLKRIWGGKSAPE